MENLIGKVLGQYELVEIVGEGGLATVYKAYQKKLERWVAVKVLHSKDRDLLTRFEREAKAVAQLRHRNILMVHEYGEDAGWPYIAMEYVKEGTLENYLVNKPMIDWARVVMLTIPIAQALHHAHEHGLIHRDVKPSNVLMPQPDWPLLADFGLVKMRNPDQDITASDVVIGTPAYISPEQASAGTVDPRADMYSLGVVMYQLLTGQLPFAYKNPNEMINAHISEPIPSPNQFKQTCPLELEEVILTMLQKSPDARYADLQVVANTLQKISKGTTRPFPSSDISVEEPFAPEDNRPTPTTHKSPSGIISEQAIKILLRDQNVTIDIPEPGEEGLIIGRRHKQAQVDIDLDPYGALNAGVSRRHARLTCQGAEWFIDDLESLNGTYVNKKKVTPDTPVRLKNGDLIQCSKLSFIFLISFKS